MQLCGSLSHQDDDKTTTRYGRTCSHVFRTDQPYMYAHTHTCAGACVAAMYWHTTRDASMQHTHICIVYIYILYYTLHAWYKLCFFLTCTLLPCRGGTYALTFQVQWILMMRCVWCRGLVMQDALQLRGS